MMETQKAEAAPAATFDAALNTARSVIVGLDTLAEQLDSMRESDLPLDDRVVLDALRASLARRAVTLPLLVDASTPEAVQAPFNNNGMSVSTNGNGHVAVTPLLEYPLPDRSPVLAPEPESSVLTVVAPGELDVAFISNEEVQVGSEPEVAAVAPELPVAEPVLKTKPEAVPEIAPIPGTESMPVPAAAAIELIKHSPPDGRAIARFDRIAIDRLNTARRSIYQQDRATHIEIIDDKTLVVNGKKQPFRVPVNGAPSTVMQVLNIALDLAIGGQKSPFSQADVERIINDPLVESGTVWQAMNRLVKTGILYKHGRSERLETLFGLPTFVRLVDLRSPISKKPEEKPDFLAKEPVLV